MNERPISVGELLRREGQQSESHDSQARRALGGVAVGAVLAFGAVVGGLVLHNAGATPTDMPVAGGGSAGGMGFNGSVPIASTGTIGSHSPQVQPAANTSTTNPASTQRGTTQNGKTPVGGAASNSIAQTTDPQSYPSSSGTLPTTTGSTSTSTSTGSSTSTSTGSTSTSHGSGSSTGTSSPNSGSTSTGTSTTANSGSGSGGGGGLLGGVGDALGSVTQPVFSWFGGN